METVEVTIDRANRKTPYVLWMVAALGIHILSLMTPAISGPKLWAIYLCTAFAFSISALKLRRLIHGRGWIFPQTAAVLMCVVPLEALLYLWFSR